MRPAHEAAVSSLSEPARKRAKYTQIAWFVYPRTVAIEYTFYLYWPLTLKIPSTECKRRKIKCSGGSPCTRCAQGKALCRYSTDRIPIQDADFKDARVGPRFDAIDRHLESLQQEMRSMSARLRELEASSPASSMPAKSNTQKELDRILNAPKTPTYVGPTSAEFGLRQHQSSLNPPESAYDTDEDEPVSNSAGRSSMPHPGSGVSLHLEEVLRLLEVYEDLVGVMYPCVDMESVRVYAQDYYRSHGIITTSTDDLQDQSSEDQDWFFARDIQVLKLLLATALLAESHGRSELAAQLADSVEDHFAPRFKVAEVDMKEILIMTLLSIFHSYRDDEVISWRMTRIATSACMELGLHRQETWRQTGGVFPGELAWRWAMRLFWCVYVLDRKWSFGSGLPFGMQDTDIDTNIPEPGHSTPYLACLISHARLSTKIWGLVMEWPEHCPSTTADQCAQLDAEVRQWIWSIPPELRFSPTWSSAADAQAERSPQQDRMRMLQVLLALQGNQLRILVYRQNLQSKERIAGDPAGAMIAVETAKNTIHMLEDYSSESNIYFDRPEPFNYFLISALAALLLAVSHAPNRFSHVCRPEFYTAIRLVRRSATRARTSRRLHKLLRRLKHVQLPKGSLDHQAVSRVRQDDYKNPGSHGPAIERSRLPDQMSLVATATPRYGWDSASGHLLASNSIATPNPNLTHDRSSALWNTSLGTIEDGSRVCEDLSSFFENAGDYFFDPHLALSVQASSTADASLVRGVDMGFFSVPANPLSPSHAFDNLDAANEELTRAMAGLL
ncbi:hypothetical protein N7539_002038 [Penicillium diatomitis]|uniref:Zn(2)-C6 fungal-type domain-containing protein n=1 Tax=Penicillium diatomitis TaxID=2819901 RepID=A0A9W9XHX2_9EURO|nr:uncharacterized protein N7539_002038 [Penicillium diatomitis]KAJ5493292.1 hypothetical protein N7539_002038 [Penicillium diatomitis]